MVNIREEFGKKKPRCNEMGDWEWLPFGAVWPDVGVKSIPIFSKNCPKVSTAVLRKKSHFHNGPKVSQNILAIFVKLFVPTTLKNRTIWSHWFVGIGVTWSKNKKSPDWPSPDFGSKSKINWGQLFCSNSVVSDKLKWKVPRRVLSNCLLNQRSFYWSKTITAEHNVDWYQEQRRRGSGARLIRSTMAFKKSCHSRPLFLSLLSHNHCPWHFIFCVG